MISFHLLNIFNFQIVKKEKKSFCYGSEKWYREPRNLSPGYVSYCCTDATSHLQLI